MSADDFKKELSHIVAEVAFKHATSGGGIAWTIDSMQEAIYSALKKDWEPAITTTNTASLKLPTKVVCIQACSIGKHSDSEWQKGFDIGLSAMYDFISGQLRA
jgi:hypothetical protein